MLGPSLVRNRAQILIVQFVLKFGNSSKPLLSLGEAFTEFFPQIRDMMTIDCSTMLLHSRTSTHGIRISPKSYNIFLPNIS
ncbi:hypothetical protein CR513_17681, partial [Mucuna pruriens]